MQRVHEAELESLQLGMQRERSSAEKALQETFRVEEEKLREEARESENNLRSRLHAAAVAEVIEAHQAAEADIRKVVEQRSDCITSTQLAGIQERYEAEKAELRSCIAAAADALEAARRDLDGARQEVLRLRSERAAGAAAERMLRLQLASLADGLHQQQQQQQDAAAARTPTEGGEYRRALKLRDDTIAHQDVQLQQAALLLRQMEGTVGRRP
eukprot:Hpha_TRINITY_DN14594_c0_g2::TRINITY_DN14594_c0_g2_i3::g.46643::m.46643